MTIEKMNDSFWINYNAIFGDIEAKTHYRCGSCGTLERGDVIEDVVIDYLPVGDRLVGRREINLSCLHCGADVDWLD